MVCDVNTAQGIKRYQITLRQSIKEDYDKNFDLQQLVRLNLQLKSVDQAPLYLQQAAKKIPFNDLIIEQNIE